MKSHRRYHRTLRLINRRNEHGTRRAQTPLRPPPPTPDDDDPPFAALRCNASDTRTILFSLASRDPPAPSLSLLVPTRDRPNVTHPRDTPLHRSISFVLVNFLSSPNDHPKRTRPPSRPFFFARVFFRPTPPDSLSPTSPRATPVPPFFS